MGPLLVQELTSLSITPGRIRAVLPVNQTAPASARLLLHQSQGCRSLDLDRALRLVGIRIPQPTKKIRRQIQLEAQRFKNTQSR